MKLTQNIAIALFLSFAITPGIFAQTSPKDKVQAIRESIIRTHKDIDWNAFDTASKIPIDSINAEALQGVWKAYNGVFKFNGTVNSMELITPLVLEFKEDGFRTDPHAAFRKFALTKNYLQSLAGTWNGYINSVSDKLLVLTLNSGQNRTRYYYEK